MGKRGRHRMLDHIIDRQIRPQQLAAQAREQGLNVEARFVTTHPDAEGFVVTCQGCGRTAKAAQAPPEDMVVLCPDCM